MFHFCMANGARGQEPTNFDFVSIRALRDVTRWTQLRSERNTTWSHWRRRREVENMALLASAARRAARTTAIQKAFRCICSQRTNKYDEKYIKFVQQCRADFVEEAVNSAHCSLCSGHFEESCFTRKPAVQLERMKLKRT